MFIEGFLGYECILLELFDTPVPGLIGITLTMSKSESVFPNISVINKL